MCASLPCFHEARAFCSVEVNVSHNQLSSLPKNLGALKALVKLDASHNSLTDVPESMDELTSLEVR